MDKIKAGIIGVTGYAGVELFRLLLGHPHAEISAVSSVSFAGKALSDIYPVYRGISELICETQDAVLEKCDVIFAALPHGLSEPLASACDAAGKLLIDLGADFRLQDEAVYQAWYQGAFQDPALHKKAVYGLPECFRDQIKGKRLVANPGCYTTAVPLALYPALKKGYIKQEGIIADCKSGVTGAGRSPSQQNHFPELNENFFAYKIAAHRHAPEIQQSLSTIAGADVHVTFVPHLLPVNRGILATCYAKLKPGITEEMLQEAYRHQYDQEAFIRLLPNGQSPQLRSVRYSNYCDIGLTVDVHTGTLIAISAIDNMVKGAAGQAIQNMNLCMGLTETTGLCLIPPAV